MEKPNGAKAWLFRVLGTLSLLFIVGVSVVDISEGRWWLAIVRLAVIGALSYWLYRTAKRRDHR